MPMNLIGWASRSLRGHIVLFETFFSIPMFFLFLDPGPTGLTVGWALYSAAVWAAGGAVVAILFWYTVTAPLIKRKRGN
jgi:hypothetical protein